MSATEILVIILSTMLALFLVLSIILVVMLIRISRQIQAITNVARTTVENFEQFSANIAKMVAPATLLKLGKNIFKKVTGRR